MGGAKLNVHAELFPQDDKTQKIFKYGINVDHDTPEKFKDEKPESFKKKNLSCGTKLRLHRQCAKISSRPPEAPDAWVRIGVLRIQNNECGRK